MKQSDFLRIAQSLRPVSRPPARASEFRNESHTEAYVRLAELSAQPMILLDLDGTLAEFVWPGVSAYDPYRIGPPRIGARELTHELAKLGTLAVLTQRMTFWSLDSKVCPTTSVNALADTIRAWLTRHGFPPMRVLPSHYVPPFHVAHVGDSLVDINAPDVLARVRTLCESFKRDKETDNVLSEMETR